MHRVEHHTPEERDEINRRQEAEVSKKESEYIVLTRSEDRSLLLRISYVLDKYKVLIYLAGMFLVAMGFGFKTPAQNYKELSDRIDILAAQVRRDSAQKAETNDKLNVLITFQCMGQNARDMAIARVDCSRYIPYLQAPGVKP